MKALLEPIKEQLVAVEEAFQLFRLRHGEILDQEASVEADIHNTFARLQQVLDARILTLIHQVHQLTQIKLKRLKMQEDVLDTIHAKLKSCLLFTEDNLQTSKQEALLMKSTTLSRVKKLTATFQPGMLEPNTEADMIFSALTDLTTECQNYGEVYAMSATGMGANIAAVGEKATVLLQTTADFSNQPPTTSISSEVTSEITGIRARGCVERRGQVHYEVCYQPIVKGRHQLHITVKGQHIKGSPFPVSVKSPAEKLGAPISTIGGIAEPWGVAVNKKGEVVVTEFDRHCVSVFSLSGEKLRSFGMRGSGPGQLKNPCGVAVDAEDNILVCDNNNHRIQKFSAQGRFLTAVGTQGNGPLQFNFPRGIAVSSSSNKKVYVVSNHDVQILNPDLSYAGRFGTLGGDECEFNAPCGIACDSIGNVYIADSNNHRIQVFTAEGTFLRMFGRCGGDGVKMKRPHGIAIDSSDRVYVSEWANHCVSVLTSEGELVTVFGSEGEKPGQFEYPHGVTVDSCGVVYVCDMEDRIQLF